MKNNFSTWFATWYCRLAMLIFITLNLFIILMLMLGLIDFDKKVNIGIVFTLILVCFAEDIFWPKSKDYKNMVG